MEHKSNSDFLYQIKENFMQTYLERLQENDTIFDEIRYPTGFRAFDQALAGGYTAGLHCIGAISSLGKTTFVLQMAENMASKGTPVIIFSLEMRPEQLVAKAVSRNMYLFSIEQKGRQENNIVSLAKSYSELMSEEKRKSFTEQEKYVYADAIKRTSMSTSDMQIVSETEDGKPFNIDEIVNYINTYIAATKKKPVVVIDYLQFIRPGVLTGSTDKQTMDYIISMLVFTAKIQRIPIIALSSLNRVGYESPVTMASFKESGFIEYSCETMIGLQLKGVGKKNFNITEAKAKSPREIELVLIKGRGIEVGAVIDYLFYGRHNYFKEMETVIEPKTAQKRIR